MIGLLLALVGCAATLAYGYAADSWLAVLAGWFGVLVFLGLSQLPVFRRVASASEDLAARRAGPLTPNEARAIDGLCPFCGACSTPAHPRVEHQPERYEPVWDWPDRWAA